MKRLLFFCSLLLMIPLAMTAQTAKPYARYDAETTTLTFYYGSDYQSGDYVYDNTKGWSDGDYSSMFPEAVSSNTTKVVFTNANAGTNYRYMFCEFTKLEEVEGLDKLDTKNVTDMGAMFGGCSGLTSLDVSNFNTSNVTDMSTMFSGCSGLTSLDVSNFNTENVTSMVFMFYGCFSLTSLDLSNFNTENVTRMYGMFLQCKALTSLDLSNFNTENVTSMFYMFDGCFSLTSLDLSNFNTASVTNMGGMFSRCEALTSLDVSNFNTANVTNMSTMFDGCSSLTTIYCNDKWDCSRSSNMFSGCTSLVGEDGTKYREGNDDVSYAHPNAGGYFTKMKTTGISGLDGLAVSQSANAVYDLSGRQLPDGKSANGQMRKGIYIVRSAEGRLQGKNGKKVVR